MYDTKMRRMDADCKAMEALAKLEQAHTLLVAAIADSPDERVRDMAVQTARQVQKAQVKGKATVDLNGAIMRGETQ